MAEASTAATTTHTAATAAATSATTTTTLIAPTLPRNPSMGSLSSLVSFSLSSAPERTHGLITAPCSRCGHAEPIKSLLSVFERTLLRCQSCSVSATATSPTAPESLHRAFSDLEGTLQRHGEELERLSVLLPPSREPSIIDGISDDERRIVSTSSSLGLGAGNPLVHDVEDLKHLTASVTRLLRTLHRKASRLDQEEKVLRKEREEVEREREEVKKLKEEFESRRPSKSSTELSEDVRRDAKTLSLTRTTSFATIDYNSEPIVWNEEKEQELADLEQRLSTANKNWSDEQEDVLPMVERLREERRKAKKQHRSTHSRHSSSIKIDLPDFPAPEDGKRRSFSAFSLGRRDSKLSLKNRRSSVGDAAGNPAPLTSPGMKLVRLFSGGGRKTKG